MGPFTTAMEPDELLTHVRFPATAGARTVFLEFAGRTGDFALAGVCAINRGTAERARVALAAIGVGGSPVRLSDAEAAVEGRALTEEAVREAGEAASAAVDPPRICTATPRIAASSWARWFAARSAGSPDIGSARLRVEAAPGRSPPARGGSARSGPR